MEVEEGLLCKNGITPGCEFVAWFFSQNYVILVVHQAYMGFIDEISLAF